jgi:hypothetical protein
MELPPFDMKKALKLADADLARYVMGYLIASEAEESGIPLNEIPHDFATRVVHAALTAEADTARGAALEKALRKAASGDLASAGKLLREYLSEGAIHLAALDEAITGKRRQSANGRKPRPDELQLLIEGILAARPDIKLASLLGELRRSQDGEVIDNIDDAEGVIEWRGKNNPAGTAPISGLKDRLSRARKKLASR